MAQFSMNIWFVNRISNGGYFVEDGWVREVDPSSGYKRFEFTDELYVAALREIAKLKEVIEQPKISQSEKDLRTVQFYNHFGPLSGPEPLMKGEPIGLLTTLVAMNMSISGKPKEVRKLEIELVQIPDDTGKLVTHIKPEIFAEALLWAIEFQPEKTFTTCQYFLRVGSNRKRNKGKVCPRFCVIQTDGRRQWDDGCQKAYWDFETKQQKEES